MRPIIWQISFSSTDYVGHLFGPSSLETEDNILRLDRILAELFQYVDKKVGLDKTLIVLSADHGAPEAPEYMAEHGMETGRFPLDWFKKGSPLLDALKNRFGRDDLVATHSHPYLYLNLDAIKEAKLDIEKVEQLCCRGNDESTGDCLCHDPQRLICRAHNRVAYPEPDPAQFSSCTFRQHPYGAGALLVFTLQ